MPVTNFAKISVGFAICTFAGLYSFYLSKTSIESRRYENMKARERMRLANVGEYEASPRKFSGTH